MFEYNPRKKKKEETWFDNFLTGLWYRGTDIRGKGVGVAFMGEGFYLTWNSDTARVFADLSAGNMDLKFRRSKTKKPAKILTYRLQPGLLILDNQSETMIKIKEKLGVNPWDKIDDPLFARLMTRYVKEEGYDGVIDDNPADGLVIYDSDKATLVNSEVI